MSSNASTLPTPAADLTRAQWQPEIFRETPRRTGILGLVDQFTLRGIRLRVHRNQPFEFIAASLPKFLAYAGYAAQIDYTDYDDSLSSTDETAADAELLWLDYTRYRDQDGLVEWLAGRIGAVRAYSSAPVLLATRAAAGPEAEAFNRRLAELAGSMPGVYLCDLTPAMRKLGAQFFDTRARQIAAMTLSGAACLELSRLFGLVWIPAALGRRVKAVLVDLDNTLYEGVLGEDGAAGVRLTEAHRALQQALVAYREQGVFLGAVSRNERSDVEELFRQRTDFPLRLDDFSTLSISWRPKSEGIREAAAELRIGLDAVLFIDDNPGELLAVTSEIAEIHTLHAADLAETARALSLYPGLAGVPRTTEDSLRVADLAASQARTLLERETASPEQYLASLGIELTFHLNPEALLERLHELSNKTNQFNTAFRRFTAAEVSGRLQDASAAAVAVRLRDRLSDSGVIAALFTRWDGGALVVEELVISCRALGRRIESRLVSEALRGICGVAERTPERVRFVYVEGPRNQPARDWLAEYTGTAPGDGATVEIAWAERTDGPGGAISMNWEKL